MAGKDNEQKLFEIIDNNDYGIKKFNVTFNPVYVNNLVVSIQSLKHTIKPFQQNYMSLVNQIQRQSFYTEQMKSFLAYIDGLFEFFEAPLINIESIFPKPIDKVCQLKGSYKDLQFHQGCALYNQKAFYQGEFNNSNFQFKGLIIPDFTIPTIQIGQIINNKFQGIIISKKGNVLKKIIYTDSFEIELRDNNTSICVLFIHDTNECFYFKDNSYFITENNKSSSNYCYFYLWNNMIYSFEKSKVQSFLQIPIIIIYPNNHLYKGFLENSKRQREGQYYIRNQLNADEMNQYELIGLFKENDIVKGKVMKGETLVYDGLFENNQPIQGKYYFSENEWYEGDIVDNKITGVGKYTYNDGSVFQGEFNNSLPIKGCFNDLFQVSNEIHITNEMLIFEEQEKILL